MDQWIWNKERQCIDLRYQKYKKRALTPQATIIDKNGQLDNKNNNSQQMAPELFVAYHSMNNQLNYLFLRNIKCTNADHMNLLKKIHEAYPKIEGIWMAECKVNEEIINCVPNVQILSFQGCNIRNRLADILEQSYCQGLQRILLHSDHIGNIGIKKLMKISMPNLKSFCLHNTNLTMDFAKLISKKEWKNKIGFKISEQKYFNYDRLMKTMKHMDTKEVQEYHMHMVGHFYWDSNTFLYWGQLSKIRINNIIYTVKRARCQVASSQYIHNLQKSLMIPHKTKLLLEWLIRDSTDPEN